MAAACRGVKVARSSSLLVVRRGRRGRATQGEKSVLGEGSYLSMPGLVAVITGGASGLGLAMAERLTRQGPLQCFWTRPTWRERPRPRSYARASPSPSPPTMELLIPRCQVWIHPWESSPTSPG
ncbi:uncharacterized protein LOC143672025 [Tamandua tetradactyla]|uniref:uncharacterized protein LOC143672025 n=1 Tax=Tamandua tetradactyla TaxID=48850 RepID=UPI0040540424